MKDEMRELTARDFARALPRRVRDRLLRGKFQSGDVAALRSFTGLSQEMFALWIVEPGRIRIHEPGL